jgi:hypothetical protein
MIALLASSSSSSSDPFIPRAVVDAWNTEYGLYDEEIQSFGQFLLQTGIFSKIEG